MIDKKTVIYFDEFTPEYSPVRLQCALSFIRRYSSRDSSLIDIGCGTGNILEVIQNGTPIQRFCGMDVSKNNLLLTGEKINCETVHGSILDPNVVKKMRQTYDFAILGAVLHHLVGRTRKESRRYAFAAIRNSLDLLKKNGYLIILEPVFSPSLAMDIVFYVKRAFSTVTDKRINILGKWNNIGAPIVSYFTGKQLLGMLRGIDDCQIIATELTKINLRVLWRLALISRRHDMTVVIRKVN